MRASAAPKARVPRDAGAASGLRAAIVAEARAWLGTPYRHQASAKGAGADCVGLIRGLWRACIGPEPEAVPAYSADYGLASGTEPVLALARRHLIEIEAVAALPGDLLVFRMKRHWPAKHAGILTDGTCSAHAAERNAGRRRSRISRRLVAGAASGLQGARFVHAQEGVGVVEAALSDWWRARVVAAFRFPGVT